VKTKNNDLSPKIAIQSLLRPELTKVCSNKDYEEFKSTIGSIDKIIRESRIEKEIVAAVLKKHEGLKLSVKQLSKQALISIKAFRTETLRFLLGQPSFRELSIEISKSDLLADFCLALSLNGITGVSKSSLDRNSKLFTELELYTIHQNLTKELIGNEIGLLPHSLEVESQFVDSTCIEANIHHPTDWVCLKDFCFSVLNSIEVIRKYNILNRLPKEIKEFKRELNQLCIGMAHARRSKDSSRKRKQIFRELKKLTTQIGKHGKKHLEKLKQEWTNTKLSLKQREYIQERLSSLLELESHIVSQAHERIIGGRLVKNESKILSIYDLEIEVLKRGKAGKDVEFGNKFYISENADGYILDYSLSTGNPDDRALLEESLNRLQAAGLKTPKSICADRGFYGIRFSNKLKQRGIIDNSCPKGVNKLQEKLKEPEFVKQQKRRAGTEARIGILKAKFSLNSLNSKGFTNRSRSCAWAVLTHNLWMLCKQILAVQRSKKEAA